MKAKILVVDDEKSMQELLKNVLTMSGFEVSIAGDDVEFKAEVKKEKPDVIILDLVLGDKDGSQVYQELLAQGLDRNIPVVFLSALAEDRPATLPRPDRKYSLVGKPFDPDVLVQNLQRMVSACP